MLQCVVFENRAAVISIFATRGDGAYILSGGHIAKQTEDRGKGKFGLSTPNREAVAKVMLSSSTGAGRAVATT